jgi:hypothetical protein
MNDEQSVRVVHCALFIVYTVMFLKTTQCAGHTVF